MYAVAKFRAHALLAVLLISSAACKQSAGTFVLLKFDGTIPEGKPILSIAVSLQLGTRTDSTVFSAPAGGAIALPTDATLQIDSGDGDLAVAATALAGDQTPLATGSTHGPVTAGQTITITVHLGSTNSDAGTGGSADAQQDSQVGGKDATADAPNPLGDAVAPDLFRALADAADLSPGTKDAGTGGLGGTGGSGLGGATASDGGSAPDGDAAGGAGGTLSGGSGGAAMGGASGTFQLSSPVSALDFGAVPVGSVSAPQTLTITNLGAGISPALVIFVNDGHHFPMFQDRCSGAVLRPGDTCTLAFTFNPDAAGSLQTNGTVGPAQGPAAQFTLGGTGSSGVTTLNMSPSTVDFKAVDVGISSAVSFTVTNNGTADSGPLKILVNPASAFQITNDRCSITTLGKLGQCTFSLVFAPQTIGPVSATIAAQSASGIVATSSASGVGQDRVQLTIQFAGAGGGTVTGPNLNCPSITACSIGIVRTDPSSFPRLDLSALANSASLFSGWSGACTGTGNCTLVMDSAKTVTATFDPIKP